MKLTTIQLPSFNPLDRGNSNQMISNRTVAYLNNKICFNPLDRGNSNQIIGINASSEFSIEFQSPRSGKF